MQTEEQLALAKKALTGRLLQLKLGRGVVSDLVNGRSKPSLERATQIERATGIPSSAWVDGTQLEEMWKQIIRTST